MELVINLFLKYHFLIRRLKENPYEDLFHVHDLRGVMAVHDWK